jgi:hypothetical protein
MGAHDQPIGASDFDAHKAILFAPWPNDLPSAEDLEREAQKVWATAQARAALRGIVLVKSHDDRGRPEWIASYHALTRAFGSLEDVLAWLDRVEGKQR